MSFKTIVFTLEGAVARLRLNRPERLNAFTRQMHAELDEALSTVEENRAIRVLLVTGTGRAFCAGQDLAERDANASEAFDLGASLETYYNPLIRRLAKLPVPAVCAVNGVAAGAGASLALACDMVVARRSASFVQAFSRIGLIPDSGGTWFLVQHLGYARALGLAMIGAPIDAEKAEQWGLIWKAVDDENFESYVEALILQLASAPIKSLVSIRSALRSATTTPFFEQLDIERDMQRKLGLSTDYREGISAFKEKRRPLFRDR